MRWDIDKALAALEDSSIAGTNLTRVTVRGVEMMEEEIGDLTDEERAQGYVKVWCLALGKEREANLFVYGRTIQTAYLRARRVVKKLSAEDLALFGLRAPKKKPKPRR